MTSEFDLLILDLGLPKLSGLEVLRRLRTRRSRLRLLIVTALDGDHVRRLDHDADDYLTKPFALAELKARVRALTGQGAAGSSTLQHGELTFDTIGRTAAMRGQMLDLSAHELSVLEVLLQHPGRVVGKEHLLERFRDWADEFGNNAIEIYVRGLHKKLQVGGLKIITLRGLGYVLERASADGAGAKD